ncbi:ABC transporter substrate-binding protein [Breoghania sp. L-A4]|nr:ABC transporter substrate-binding protein [Breoghania sp. L-A4]
MAAASALAPLATTLMPRFARAVSRNGAEHHGLSVFGDLKYGADFTHFDYLVPDAPKGGRIAFTAPSWAYNQNPQTFNTLNSFILKGDAPPRMELCFDSLMVRALDEPDAVYGLLARSVSVSDDGNRYRFHLRPEARFHDGTPLVAEDVAFTLMLLKEKGHPLISQTITEMVSAEALSSEVVEVAFSGKQTRQLPMVVAGLPVFSRRYYETQDFTKTTMEPPLGSGPYRVGAFEQGRTIDYERVEDWWARDLPVARGAFNFDVIRIEFFRDRQIAFEAMKKGKLTFYEEFVSKSWATEYDFPAVRDGRVIKTTFPDDRPAGAQGWFFNTRRDKFSDPRTREAIGLAFDFEWTNQNLFYGLYERTNSFFQNSEMMAHGVPSAEELTLLEPLRGQLSADVFGEVWRAPVSDGSGQDRALFRRATELLRDAGWIREGQTLVSASGTPLTVEFLSNSPSFERVILPYVKNLRLIGVEATFRVVDSAQYQSRLNDFDFDAVGRRYAMEATPGEGIRQFWGSDAAGRPGSNNLAGISDPAVDALIEKIIHADSREAMTIACKVLDRVLRASHYWVPNWYKASHAVAYWDRFGFPPEKPRYGFPVETTWWSDGTKAATFD